MRHMSRTHGISVASLHELYVAGHFTVEYVPSALQAADIFTKAFSVPRQWDNVCRLVNVCRAEAIGEMVTQVGVPFGEVPNAESKHGLWFLRPDGSGAWVRRDRRCSRHRTLRGAGPQRSEITARHTYCSLTRRTLAPTMLDYPTTKEVAAELPPEVPRDIITIFEFRRSTQRVVDGAITIAQDAPLVSTILSTIFS